MESIYKVTVAGLEFSVYSGESEEYTQGIAKAVNRKIREIADSSAGVHTLNAAVLAAMDYCDESVKAKAEKVNLRNALEELQEKLAETTKELEKLKGENLTLKMGKKG